MCRWMDGNFSDLNADTISSELDDCVKELYKIQKTFSAKLKKMHAQRDEKEDERKRRKRRKSSVAAELNADGSPVGSSKDEPIPEVVPPAAIEVCITVLDQMNQFKV